MILLITLDTDQSINNLIDWLNRFDLDFFRFNEEDKVEDLTITLNNNNFYFNILIKDKGYISSKKIKAVYYRGGQFLPANFFIDKISKSQKQYLKGEWEVINNFFMAFFEELPCLGGFNKETQNNKIKNLLLAQKCGLKIPMTIITSNLDDALKTFSNGIITKVLKKEIYYEEEGYAYYSEGTQLLTLDEIKPSPNNFFPTQFQEAVIKQFELRVFFINDKTYTMAIIPLSNRISQEQNIDYRVFENNEITKLYKNIPYCLPIIIEEKIKALMSCLGLKIGSIDFIVDKNDEYIFLEINPVGQYHWVSFFCNYNLDEKIAIELKEIIYG